MFTNTASVPYGLDASAGTPVNSKKRAFDEAGMPKESSFRPFKK